MFSEILKKRFAEKKVLIMGLGLQGGGAGAARFFASCGAKLTITDAKKKSELAPVLQKIKGISYKQVFGRHNLKDFLSAEYIFKNPSVKWDNYYIEKAGKKGVPILTEASIFFDTFPKEKIIGVTGTKGKSTTSALICHCLKSKFKAELAGSPQTSALQILLSKKPPDFVVYELSSFMLENLKASPKYAVITNFLPDHLDRYGNVKNYWQAKKNIFKWQKPSDKVFLSKNDPILKKWGRFLPKGRVQWFQHFGYAIAEKGGRQCINSSNLGAAFAILGFLGFSENQFRKCLINFQTLEGRMQYVAEKNKVIFINDTTATNPSAAGSSIKEIKKFYNLPYKKIVVIFGGVDKNLPYAPLEPLLKLIKHAVVLPGTAFQKLLPFLRKSGASFEEAKTLKEAVNKVVLKSEKGDIVLLSPAAASFNLFKNEFDRGRQFVKIVRKL